MKRKQMGTFRVDCEIAHLKRQKHAVLVPRMLVDTGAEYSWFPEEVLRGLGIKAVKKDLVFQMANGETITRSIGFAFLRAGEFFTVDEVVFAQPGDLALLGARTLEGFGARVDPRLKRLVASGPHPAAGVGLLAG
jgi:predicted aspartyl protease